MDSTTYNLDLSFQPVVATVSGDIDHHEIFGRFPNLDLSAPTEEGEQATDLGAALDLALAQGVVTLLQGRPHDRLLLPISWRSSALDLFRGELEGLLRIDPSVRRRVILEFVAADDIFAIEEAANYMASLRRLGCNICLSHFGAGASSYRFLRYLDVDYVKIDTQFMAAALVDPRERRLLSELGKLCNELDFKGIANGIDDARQADLAARCGIGLGQGQFYGLPQETFSGSGLPVHLHSGLSMPGRVPFFLH